MFSSPPSKLSPSIPADRRKTITLIELFDESENFALDTLLRLKDVIKTITPYIHKSGDNPIPIDEANELCNIIEVIFHYEIKTLDNIDMSLKLWNLLETLQISPLSGSTFRSTITEIALNDILKSPTAKVRGFIKTCLNTRNMDVVVHWMIQNLMIVESVYTKDSIFLQKEYCDMFHSMLRSLKVLPLKFSIDNSLINSDIWKDKLLILNERRSKNLSIFDNVLKYVEIGKYNMNELLDKAIDNTTNNDNSDIIFLMINYLMKHANVNGIFINAANVYNINQLYSALQDETKYLDPILISRNLVVLLKTLDHPILATDIGVIPYLNCLEIEDFDHRIRNMALLIDQIPAINKAILSALLSLYSALLLPTNCELNGLNIVSLAAISAPFMFKAKSYPVSFVIYFIVQNSDKILTQLDNLNQLSFVK